MTIDADALRQKYEAAGQGHVFHFYSKLSQSEQQNLLEQLSGIDVSRINRIYTKAIEGEKEASSSHEIEPLPEDKFASIVGSKNTGKEDKWRSIGLDAVGKGQVGVLLMAGGQGTRLGSSAPKGCYDIKLPSGASLFQIQAERIRGLQILAAKAAGKKADSVVVPWYIMTSGPTRRETEAFFVKNQYFGLSPENVIFFNQGTLPCLSPEGKILLETPSRVAVAPDGNGGLYAALRTPLSSSSPRTVLSDLASRNVSYIHAYCVDNCLVRVADPVFLGFCISNKAACAAKVVRKNYPEESVGVVVVRDHRFGVVEYSEISKEQAARRDAKTGELAFRAANIVNHFYTADFLRSVESFEDQMAFHIARKKIPTVDFATGELVKPSKPNGMKLEMFVFDVFPFTQQFSVLEVERAEEFSPLKNAPGTGSDDPDTSRRDLLAQQRRWLEKAGAKVHADSEIELSPLVTYAGEGLDELKGKVLIKEGLAAGASDLGRLVKA